MYCEIINDPSLTKHFIKKSSIFTLKKVYIIPLDVAHQVETDYVVILLVQY